MMLVRPILLVLVCVAPLPAQDPGVARLADGTRVAGLLVGAEASGTLLMQTSAGIQRLDPAETICITWERAPLAPPVGGVRVELVSGDLLVGILDDGELERVRIVSSAVGPVHLDLEELRTIAFPAFLAGPALPPEPPSDADQVLLLSGDRLDEVRGEIQRVTRSGVSLVTADGKERTFSFTEDQVAMVRLSELVPHEPPAGLVAALAFADGSRLTGRLSGAGEGPVRLDLAAGPVVTPRLAALARLEIQGGCCSWLSDLQPASVEQVPWIGRSDPGPVLRDAGFAGAPSLEIGRERFARGLGLHARTVITWDLAGAWSSLRAQAGVDPATRNAPIAGSVVMRLMVDGREAWRSPLLSAGGEPVPVALDGLKDGQRLTLVVDFAGSGPVGARGVLGDAVLLR